MRSQSRHVPGSERRFVHLPPNQVFVLRRPRLPVPAGDYWIGIACTQADGGSIISNVKYWSTKVTIATAPGAGPNNFTFAPATSVTTSHHDGGFGATTTTTCRPAPPDDQSPGATTTRPWPARPRPPPLPALRPAPPSARRSDCRCLLPRHLPELPGRGDHHGHAAPVDASVTTAVCRVVAAGRGSRVRSRRRRPRGTATATFTAAPTAPGPTRSRRPARSAPQERRRS